LGKVGKAPAAPRRALTLVTPDGLTVDDVARILRALNAKARADLIAIYAEAFVEYRMAAANVEEHGPIVFHPRTGAPIENPFARVRQRAALTLERIRLNTGPLWVQRGKD